MRQCDNKATAFKANSAIRAFLILSFPKWCFLIILPMPGFMFWVDEKKAS
jgi:hypothetical protein